MTGTLVLHPGALGDILLALPLFRALKEKFHDRKLSVAGNTDALELLKGYVIDEVYSANVFSPLFIAGDDDPRRFKFFEGFEPIISFINDPDNTVCDNLANIASGSVVCSSWSRDLDIHSSEHFLHIARPVLGDVELKSNDGALLRDLDLPRHPETHALDKYIVIHPGSGSVSKCWPPTHLHEVIESIKRKSDMEVVLILGPADDSFSPPNNVKIFHNRPLIEVASILKHAAIYLGNDSGITHLAAALGTPTVALFGPTNPAIWAPRGDHVKILNKNYDCSPCRAFGPSSCSQSPEYACLENIAPEEVVEMIQESF